MTADTPSLTDTQGQRRTHGWRWAPAGVLTFVAPQEDGVKRFTVTPSPDEGVDKMIGGSGT